MATSGLAPRARRHAGRRSGRWPAQTHPLVGHDHDRAECYRLVTANATVQPHRPGPDKQDPARARRRRRAERRTRAADVVVVDLAAINRPERVGEAVASTLGLRTPGGRTPSDVADALSGRELLLVLDSCERIARRLPRPGHGASAAAPTSARARHLAVTLHVPASTSCVCSRCRSRATPPDLDALRRPPAVQAFLDMPNTGADNFDLDHADAVPTWWRYCAASTACPRRSSSPPARSR